MEDAETPADPLRSRWEESTRVSVGRAHAERRCRGEAPHGAQSRDAVATTAPKEEPNNRPGWRTRQAMPAFVYSISAQHFGTPGNSREGPRGASNSVPEVCSAPAAREFGGEHASTADDSATAVSPKAAVESQLPARIPTPPDEPRGAVGRRRVRAAAAMAEQRRRPRPARPDGDLPLDVPGLVAELEGHLGLGPWAGGPASPEPARIQELAKALAGLAYKMRPADALRVLTLTAEGAARVEADAHAVSGPIGRTPETLWQGIAGERAAEELREAAKRITAALAARVLNSSARFVAEALSAMAVTLTGEQEYLDSMLAQLLLLLQRERRTFVPPVIACIMGAVGHLRQEGGANGCALCARSGAGERATSDNCRFLAAFHERLVEALPDFLDDEFGLLHETYVSTYLNEEELSRLLYRAAQLQVGLRDFSAQHLGVMQRIEAALRAERPVFLKTLPDFTRGYCEKLAAATG